VRPSNPFARGKAPRLVVDLTDYGYQYAGIRPLGEAEQHVRLYHFVLPFHQLRPSRSMGGTFMVEGHAWVPIDDGETMVYNWQHSVTEAPLTDEDRMERWLGNGPAYVDQRTFRPHRNRHNDYLIDRAVQRRETFTGIEGVNQQDRAIQESMGRIVDRSREHLGPADKAIIQARRLLREAVAVAAAGGTPAGVAPSYRALLAAEGVLPRDQDWRAALTPMAAGAAALQTA
jgi:hypothetical protein